MTTTFFSSADIEFAQKYARQQYDHTLDEHVKAGQRIQSQIVEKTKFWAASINIAGFESRRLGKWLHYKNFAHYSWAQIFKPKDFNRGIYFTVGVEYKTGELVYKLDCQSNAPWRNAKKKIELTVEGIGLFKDLIEGTDAEWQSVSLERINQYNWERLIKETEQFIRKFEYLYDKAIQITSSGQHKNVRPLFRLTKQEPSNLPRIGSPTGSRSSGHDYIKSMQWRKELGLKGEKLVLKNEKEYLRLNKRKDLAKQVDHVSQTKGDGEGYDILSFTLDGKRKYIEVKTTVGPAHKEFYFTDDEIQFSRDNQDEYYLYRVYDFDGKRMIGGFVERQGSVEVICNLRPIAFAATLKK